MRVKNRKISPTIVADVKRFSHQIKRTKFSAHTGDKLVDVPYDVTFAFVFHAFRPNGPIYKEASD